MNEIALFLVAGLGIFLFGMNMLEEGLKDAAGNRFKRLLRSYTSSIPRSISFGVVATSILQSSSALTLMTLSFVGAKLINLASAIAVIYGSNIGTTFTSWLVAIIGFKVDIGAYSLIFFGVGGIMLTFWSKNYKISAMSKMLAGFGMVFLGLEYLKDAASVVQESFDLSDYLGFPLVAYVLIGFVLTAIIQSSLAAITIVLSAINSQIIGFEVAAAMIIGTNIGTTATAMLGALGGNADKKRAALSHFVFNIITAFVAFIFIYQLIYIVDHIPYVQGSPILELVMFHTLFNVLGVLIMSPFITKTATILNRLFVQKEKSVTEYVDKVNLEEVDIAIIAYKQEVINMYKKTVDFVLCLFNVDPDDVLIKRKKSWMILAEAKEVNRDCAKLYRDIKKLEIAILGFNSRLSQKELKEGEIRSINLLLGATKELSFSVKTLKDIKNDLIFLEGEDGYLRESYFFYKQKTLKSFESIVELLNDGKDEESSQKIAKIYESLKLEYAEVVSKITEAIKKYDIGEEEAASLVHLSRGYVEAFEAMMKTLEFLFKVDEKESIGGDNGAGDGNQKL